MSKVNIKNEQIKRNYFISLKEAEGLCDATIDCHEKAILNYEKFTNNADYCTFTSNKAIDFKNWLIKKEYRGKVLSITTRYSYLRHLRKFFIWLSDKAGYKSKINFESIKYLKISEKDEKIATQYIPRKYPTLEEVIKIVNTIEIKSEIDLRDRALISFTTLSGMRDKSIITLPINCFDPESLTISQNPKEGVQTKFSKYIPSVLLRFDDKLIAFVIDWINHLKRKNFGLRDPLFPRNKKKQENSNLSFDNSDSVEPEYWLTTGPIREIFKKRSKDANLPYYPPHTFRHLAIELAIKNCKNGEQIKAVSQNFGHENVATTFRSYANSEPQKLSKILSNIDFSGKKSDNESTKLMKIKEILNSEDI